MIEPSHGQPEPLDALEHQARSHYAAGRYQAAIELFDEVLTRLDVDLEPVRPRVLAIRNDLARACRYAGRFDRALSLYRQILNLLLVRSGPNLSLIHI